MAYSAPPAKNEISNTPSPTNAAANAGFGKLWDMITNLFGTTGKPGDAYAAMKLFDSKTLLNLKPTFSVAANALTITLKDKDAVDLSENNPGFVAQRHATIGDGGFNLRKIAANISLVISSGSTLGHGAGVLLPINIYLIDNAGVQELAVSRKFFGESGIVSTTAEGGAGGADSATTMYSTTARANVPFRRIAVAWSNQAAAGVWAALPTTVEVPPLPVDLPAAVTDSFKGVTSGLALSNNGADAAHDIDIAAGGAVDGAAAAFLALAATLTKRIDASWAVGSAQGGLDGTESVDGTPDINTWYYVWLIGRSDSGVVDALFSESATAPTMPAGYDRKVMIGVVRTDSGPNILPFYQDDNRFTWRAPIGVLSGGTATGSTGVTISSAVPPEAKSYQLNCQCVFSYGNVINALNFLTLRIFTAVDWMTPCGSYQTGNTGDGDDRAQVDVPNTGLLEYRNGPANHTSYSSSLQIAGFSFPR